MSSSDTPLTTAAHAIMFWLLSAMAAAVFAPCVLVPVWADVEEARAYEHDMNQVVVDLRARVGQNTRQIDALLADPLVNERIARRELNLQPKGEQVVRLSPEELAALQPNMPDSLDSSIATAADQPPEWARAVSKWLPAWPWRELFAKPANRTLLLLMSAGLLTAAFLLYGGKPVSREASGREPGFGQPLPTEA